MTQFIKSPFLAERIWDTLFRRLVGGNSLKQLKKLLLSDSSVRKIQTLQRNKRDTLFKKNRESTYPYTIFNTCHNILNIYYESYQQFFLPHTRSSQNSPKNITPPHWVNMFCLLAVNVRSREFYILMVWDCISKKSKFSGPNFLCPLIQESSYLGILHSYSNSTSPTKVKRFDECLLVHLCVCWNRIY